MLYQVVFCKEVPWSSVYNIYVLSKYSREKKRELYATILSLYKSLKEKEIGHLLRKGANISTFTPVDTLKLLIYEMLDFNPEHRPTMAQVVARLETRV
jgi:hypothetical protein